MVRSHLAGKLSPGVLKTFAPSSVGSGGGRKLSNRCTLVPYKKANGLIIELEVIITFSEYLCVVQCLRFVFDNVAAKDVDLGFYPAFSTLTGVASQPCTLLALAL